MTVRFSRDEGMAELFSSNEFEIELMNGLKRFDGLAKDGTIREIHVTLNNFVRNIKFSLPVTSIADRHYIMSTHKYRRFYESIYV